MSLSCYKTWSAPPHSTAHRPLLVDCLLPVSLNTDCAMSSNLWTTFRKDYRPSGGSSGGSSGGPGSYRSYTPADFPQLPEDRDITEGLVLKAIQSLSKPNVEENDRVKPKDVIYLGSYNWVDESHPTIIVPGESPNTRLSVSSADSPPQARLLCGKNGLCRTVSPSIVACAMSTRTTFA